MAVLSKIDQENDDVNWADELDALFDSVSISMDGPLPAKFHSFVNRTFSPKYPDNVPSLEWFEGVIPLEDPHGVAYYALIRLQDLAVEYRPNNAPLEEHIYLLLIQACAAHWESGTHDEMCLGNALTRGADAFQCGVCRLEETLAEFMDKDPVLKSWAKQNSTAGGNTLFEEVFEEISEEVAEEAAEEAYEEVSEDLPKRVFGFGRFEGDGEVNGSSGLLSPA